MQIHCLYCLDLIEIFCDIIQIYCIRDLPILYLLIYVLHYFLLYKRVFIMLLFQILLSWIVAV